MSGLPRPTRVVAVVANKAAEPDAQSYHRDKVACDGYLTNSGIQVDRRFRRPA